MFFIATADEEGRPQCSYKGGDPGFVRVLDERTIAFPGYDGNGMYLTFGNALVNPHVGLLFVDFEGRKRLRLNGIASGRRSVDAARRCRPAVWKTTGLGASSSHAIIAGSTSAVAKRRSAQVTR